MEKVECGWCGFSVPAPMANRRRAWRRGRALTLCPGCAAAHDSLCWRVARGARARRLVTLALTAAAGALAAWFAWP
jgi:hypothetical protein